MTTLDQTLDRLKSRLRDLEAQVADVSAAARVELDRLLALPAGSRLGAARMANLPLAWSLLDESRSRFLSAPDESWELSSLSLEVCDRIRQRSQVGDPDHRLCIDPALVAHAHQANVLRIREDYRGADALFASVVQGVTESSGDPAMVAEIFFLLSSLRRDQRRLPDAIACARRAATLYREIGDLGNVALAWVKIAIAQYEQCETTAGLEALAEAEAAAEEDGGELSDLLYFTIHHNRALLHVDRGEAELARAALTPRQEALYGKLGSTAVALGLTVEGLILAITPASDRAEELRLRGRALELLGTVRDQKAREGKVCDLVLCSLDMMAIYLDLGETEAVAAMLAEIEPVMTRRELQAEAITSLVLLRDALQADALSAAAVRRWRMHLRQVL